MSICVRLLKVRFQKNLKSRKSFKEDLRLYEITEAIKLKMGLLHCAVRIRLCDEESRPYHIRRFTN